jgi:hypothetical protein
MYIDVFTRRSDAFSHHDTEDKPPAQQNKNSSSLMRAPHLAIQQLQGMSVEITQARSWLRSISGGEFGSDGPHFSPCKVKEEVEAGLQGRPLYKELMHDDVDYNSFLNLRVTNRSSEASQLRSITLKLQQALRDLMSRRQQIAEQACQMDDQFAKREKAYKQQVYGAQAATMFQSYKCIRSSIMHMTTVCM